MERAKALLALLVEGMKSTQTTELQYRIQRAAPIVLHELDRAEALRESL